VRPGKGANFYGCDVSSGAGTAAPKASSDPKKTLPSSLFLFTQKSSLNRKGMLTQAKEHLKRYDARNAGHGNYRVRLLDRRNDCSGVLTERLHPAVIE